MFDKILLLGIYLFFFFDYFNNFQKKKSYKFEQQKKFREKDYFFE